ncbi:MAG: hypothetical protein M9945_07625 [Aquamicrobium sp.]|uniref:hypothetical protein n=1 Tax=Aquamicrobium sp. TaxID=1872579 RepID=UPI00349EF761|nr:hypothetical protein [Aquamicrobium sp.]
MTDVRKTIVTALMETAGMNVREQAIRVLGALHTAGYRILGPDEVDAVTLERAVVAAEERAEWVPLKAGDMATAIRALGRKA